MDPRPPGEQIAAALRRERERLGLGLAEAARRAGLGKSTLSQLESGSGNPSVETLWALATAYGVALSRLLDPPQTTWRVQRLADLPRLPAIEADYGAALLSASPPGVRRDLYLISAGPGAVKHSEPHLAGTVEHVVLCRGGARVGFDETSVELGAGDCLTYPGDRPHSFVATVPDTLAVFVVETS